MNQVQYYKAKRNTKHVFSFFLNNMQALDLYTEKKKKKSNRYALDCPVILNLADQFNDPVKWLRQQRARDWDSRLSQVSQQDPASEREGPGLPPRGWAAPASWKNGSPICSWTSYLLLLNKHVLCSSVPSLQSCAAWGKLKLLYDFKKQTN